MPTWLSIALIGVATGLDRPGFGPFPVYRIGGVDRLFGVAPRWKPG